MMVEQLNFQILDLVNQLEHAMFLSTDRRANLEVELRGLVEQREQARKATQAHTPKPAPRRNTSWSKVY